MVANELETICAEVELIDEKSGLYSHPINDERKCED